MGMWVPSHMPGGVLPQPCSIKITYLLDLLQVPPEPGGPVPCRENWSIRRRVRGRLCGWNAKVGPWELYADTCHPHRLGTRTSQWAGKDEKQVPRGKQRWHVENALSPETWPHSCSVSFNTWVLIFATVGLKCHQSNPANLLPRKQKSQHRRIPWLTFTMMCLPSWAKLAKQLSELTQKKENTELKIISFHTLSLPKFVFHEQVVCLHYYIQDSGRLRKLISKKTTVQFSQYSKLSLYGSHRPYQLLSIWSVTSPNSDVLYM